jgi:predicted 2-oxoglutarate/Fe(II)-dependent dioxygenase YbiX
MPSHTLTALGHDIYLIKGLLDPSVCNHIIQIANNQSFESAGILLNTVDAQTRSNDLLKLGGQDSLLQSTNQLILSRVAIAQQLLFQEYGVQFPYAEPCTILRYRRGQYYRSHVDNILLASRFQEVQQGIPTRDISIVGYLNHDFIGGATYFHRQKIKVKPEAGSIVVFPSYFTHPHEAQPVQQGEKYVFTSWLFH